MSALLVLEMVSPTDSLDVRQAPRALTGPEHPLGGEKVGESARNAGNGPRLHRLGSLIKETILVRTN